MREEGEAFPFHLLTSSSRQVPFPSWTDSLSAPLHLWLRSLLSTFGSMEWIHEHKKEGNLSSNLAVRVPLENNNLITADL